MAAIEPPRVARDPGIAERRVLLEGISWATYEALCSDLGDGHARLSYDRGMLEIMSPGPLHEWVKIYAGQFIEEVSIGLDDIAAFEAFGETRWRREALARGLEADQCYYFDPEKLASFAGRGPDRDDDPLPDLAVEVEITHALLNKLAIYAASACRRSGRPTRRASSS